MTESNLMRQIMKAVSSAGTRIFRNNVAMAWVGTGRPFRVSIPQEVKMYPGDILLRAARPLHAGLCLGSGDCIGFTPVQVTQAMVGTTVAVFTSIEVKEGKGIVSEEQTKFDSAVRRAGGISGIVRSVDEAVALVQGR